MVYWIKIILTERYDKELLDQGSESDTEDEDDIVGKDDIKLDDSGDEVSSKENIESASQQNQANQNNITPVKEEPPKRKISTGFLSWNRSESTDNGKKNAFNFSIPGRRKSKENLKKTSIVSDPGDLQTQSSNATEQKLKRKNAYKGPATAQTRHELRTSDVKAPTVIAGPGAQKWAERRCTI